MARSDSTTDPDGHDEPRAGRGIYDGRPSPGTLFRGRERTAGGGSGAPRGRRSSPRPWSLVLLVAVALYALASTVYIVSRTPGLGRLLRSASPSSPGPGAPARPGPSKPSDPAVPPASGSVVRGLLDGAREVRDALQEADRLMARGMAREALVHLERRRAEKPDSLGLRLAEARIHAALGDAAMARNGFVAVLGADPANLEARAGLAAALLDLNDPEGALQAAQWALDDGGTPSATLRVAVRAAIGAGQYAIAAGHARVWLRQDPESTEAQDLLGLCHLRLGEYGKASFLLGEIIREGRGTEATYLNLVLAFAQQKQFGDVADLLLKAAQRLDRARVAAWFGRPDFALIREAPVVSSVMGQVLAGTSPAPILRLPDESRDSPQGERGIGMTPAPVDLGIKRSPFP